MNLLAVAMIVKISASGFGPAEWARSEKCEVFQEQILMTRTYGKREVFYQWPFDAQDTVSQLVAEAAQEKLRLENNYMCDGPSTTVKAGDLVLYSTGGCGTPKKVRVGPASQALIDIASTFCPTTH